MGVAIAVPKSPPLFVVVHGAETKVKVVPVGTVPLEILAVISRLVPPGTMDDTFTNKSELETDVTAAPAVDVESDKVTAKIDFNASDNNKFSLKHSYTKAVNLRQAILAMSAIHVEL